MMWPSSVKNLPFYFGLLESGNKITLLFKEEYYCYNIHCSDYTMLLITLYSLKHNIIIVKTKYNYDKAGFVIKMELAYSIHSVFLATCNYFSYYFTAFLHSQFIFKVILIITKNKSVHIFN